MVHICLCFQALLMVWSLKPISIINRLRLWRKTVNLYSCFVGFTDGRGYTQQRQSAMVAAFLSAIYDYETDWYLTSNPRHSLFHQLLERYVTDENARQAAFNLFRADVDGSIFGDGLERGSVALRFYHTLIGSQWLGEYSNEEIGQYGRRLQMIDDLLDLEADAREGCTNCFLTDKREVYLLETQRFMSSSFFSELERRSLTFSLIKARCQRTYNSLRGVQPEVQGFIAACRPITMLYAAVAVALSFRLIAFEWLPVLFGATAFATVTGSIMVFNDLVDRHHDTKKGKLFASCHPWLLGRFWLLLNSLIVTFLAGTATQSVWLALYIGAVWVLGLAYSAYPVRRWYVLQSAIVASCSATPLLAGCVYRQTFSMSALLTAITFASIIVMREIVKDIEDQHCDAGYKETIPVRCGHIPAVAALIGLCVLPALLLAVHPLWSVRLTGYGLAVVQFSNGLLLLNPTRVRLVKTSIDGLMAVIMAVTLLVL